MAILRGLLNATAWLAVLCACLFVLPVAQAQSTTVIDGSQTNLVIVGQGNSSSGWIAWRSKFIPEHVIFAFELPANFTAVNPIVRCSLDDFSGQNNPINPNDTSRWNTIAISNPLIPASNPAFDVAGPSVGTAAQPATAVIVETGVFPCTAWAIQAAGNNNTFNGSGTSKITAVQLPSSGDASFLNATGNTLLTSGSIRTIPSSSNGQVGTPPGQVQQVSEQCSATLPCNFRGLMTQTNAAGFNSNGSLVDSTGGNSPLTVDLFAQAGDDVIFGVNDPVVNAEFVKFTTALGAATVQLIAAPGSLQNRIRIASIIMSNTNATATTVSVVEGTGTNCGTGTSTLIPPITLSANTGSAPNFSISFGGFAAPTTNVAGDNVCVTGSAAGAVNVTLGYARR